MILFWYVVYVDHCIFFFFKQKTAYELRISDWSSDVCSSDLDIFSRKAVLTFALAGSAILGGIGAVGHLTNGFIGRTDGYGQLLAELDHRIRPNLGLSVTCDGDGTFSPACSTSENQIGRA